MSNLASTTAPTTTVVLTSEELLRHWQGHRSLTRRAIEAFPENEFFNYSIGGMRPFYEMVIELIDIAGPGIHGIVTNEWTRLPEDTDHSLNSFAKTKKDVLDRWDEITGQINSLWPLIPPQRFQEVIKAFDQYEGPAYTSILYFIDNEIHHRAQAYVYLRSLGIQPPFFWDREF